MFRTALVAAALLSCTAPRALAQASSPTREKDGNRLVKVTLLADRETLHAGESFQLGVELVIRPAWHVYWENAGDAGKPTEIEATGPDGFVIGAPRFPCPIRHVDEGDIVSYVHEGTVLVVFDAKAPAKLEPGAKLRFQVACDWLVCTDYCLTGAGRAELELASVAVDAPARPANAKAFEQGRAKLPRPWSEVLGDKCTPRVEDGSDGTYSVAFDVPGAQELEFFPLDQPGVAFVRSEVEKRGDGARIVLHYALAASSAAKNTERPHPGVLRIKNPKGEAICSTHEPPSFVR